MTVIPYNNVLYANGWLGGVRTLIPDPLTTHINRLTTPINRPPVDSPQGTGDRLQCI
jgi:hypothetical protein